MQSKTRQDRAKQNKTREVKPEPTVASAELVYFLGDAANHADGGCYGEEMFSEMLPQSARSYPPGGREEPHHREVQGNENTRQAMLQESG